MAATDETTGAATTAVLQAKDEIRELLARYNHCVDSRDADGWIALFTADATMDLGGRSLEGPEQLRAFVAALGPAGSGVLRHYAVNEVIEVDGDRATVRCSLLAVGRTDDGPRLTTGRYEDELRREAGTWRFSRRRFVPDA